MPHVPILKNPTRHQAQAAHDLIARAINRQVPERTFGVNQTAARNAIVHDIQTDPRLANIRRASSHYARALERRNSIIQSRGGRPQQQDVAASLRRIAGQTANVRPLSKRPVTPSFAGTRAENLAGLTQAAVGYGSKDAGGLALSRRSESIRAGRRAKRYQRSRDVYKAIPKPKDRVVALGPASVNVTPVVNDAAQSLATVLAQTSLNTGDLGPRNVGQGIKRDLGMLATGPFVGGYEFGRAGIDATIGSFTGDTAQENRGVARGEKLASGVASSIYNTFAHPARSFQQDPLLSALTVLGAEGAIGRIGGATARGLGGKVDSPGLRGSLARLGSEVRPPVAYSGDAARAGVRERRYSPNLIHKAVQVANDARREPLRHPDGTVVTTVINGREVPVLKPRGVDRSGIIPGTSSLSEVQRMGRRQGNFIAARQQASEYAARDRAGQEFTVARARGEFKGIKGQHARDAVALVAEGTIRTEKSFLTDLHAYREMVAREINRHEVLGEKVFHDSKQLRDAKAQVARIDRLLNDKRVHAQIPKIVAAGTEIGKRLVLHEKYAQMMGAMDPVRADRARLIHPAVLHMGAKHWTPDELRAAGVNASAEALTHGGLRRGNGQFISNRDIERHLIASGRDPHTVAYLPPAAIGRSAFHRRFTLSRPKLGESGHTRTGEQYRRGLTTATARNVREQGVKLAVTSQKVHGIDRTVSEHGLVHPSGRYFTGAEAKEYAKRLESETDEQLIPVSAVPAKATAQMDTLARGQQTPTAMENLNQRLFNDRIDVPDNAKNVVLMPASLVNQLAKHARPANEIVKMFQWLNKPFRAAVLPQFRWLTGNFVEPFIVRLGAVGSGINLPGLAIDLRAQKRILQAGLKSSDPAVVRAAKEMQAQLGQGLFVGARGASVRRTLEELPGHEAWGPIVAKMPPVAQALQMSRTLLKGAMAPANAFFGINRVIENVANRAAFGHIARKDIKSLEGSWIKSLTVGQKAAEEAAQGLVNTPTQRRFADMQHELLGKYTGYGPSARALFQTILPFVPWFLNSARFVFWTLPAHHPVKNALLQQTAAVVQQDWEDIHKDTPPGNLKYAIPNGKGGWIDIARYTPFGAFTEAAGGGGLSAFTGQILPQIRGAQSALEGKDPFGRDLQVPPGDTPNTEAIALNQLAESLVPYLSTARRLREGGGTGYSSSTAFSPKVKPGTKHVSGLARTFSPLSPTYLRSPTGASGPASPSDQRAVRRATRAARRSAGNPAAVERALRRARRAAGG